MPHRPRGSPGRSSSRGCSGSSRAGAIAFVLITLWQSSCMHSNLASHSRPVGGGQVVGSAKGATWSRSDHRRVRLCLGVLDLAERHLERWHLHRDRFRLRGHGTGRLSFRVEVTTHRQGQRLRAARHLRVLAWMHNPVSKYLNSIQAVPHDRTIGLLLLWLALALEVLEALLLGFRWCTERSCPVAGGVLACSSGSSSLFTAGSCGRPGRPGAPRPHTLWPTGSPLFTSSRTTVRPVSP